MLCRHLLTWLVVEGAGFLKGDAVFTVVLLVVAVVHQGARARRPVEACPEAALQALGHAELPAKGQRVGLD